MGFRGGPKLTKGLHRPRDNIDFFSYTIHSTDQTHKFMRKWDEENKLSMHF